MAIILNKELAVAEDIDFGMGKVVQTRLGQEIEYSELILKQQYAPNTEVKVYTSNGDGSFSVVAQTGVYSALHYESNFDDRLDVQNWQATASQNTAISYATEATDVVVWTSNGDGTFTETIQTGMSSSKTYAEATAADVFFINSFILGSYAVDPIVDNNGDPLTEGAIYTNTVDNKLKYYTAGAWQDSVTGVSATSVDTFTNKIIDDVSNRVGANHIHYPIRNESGATILKGTVITGSTTQPGTDYLEVEPVTDPQTQIALGIVPITKYLKYYI